MQTDLVVVGGGMAGVCCAITAARAGVDVVLVQDRPVLGGNSSSEVRLWILGATAHMTNNNRWAREGGVIDEILVENTYRNPEGNPVIFDTILLEKVARELNIHLLLNTAVHEISKAESGHIESVTAFCSQNSTTYELRAPLFCDASGDGIIAFLAGAPFRMGAEAEEEFDEHFAPSEEYGELLGHSIYFYSKDTGRRIEFMAPGYALDDITRIPRYRSFSPHDDGCRLWWIEHGGRMDTVHDTETIKWELWKVVSGVWNYIKNSGEFPEAETLTLEWMGTIPGKRESRRFEGDYILTQHDIVEQRHHEDAVSYGGWSIDLHPADGIFSEKPGCNQWHARGVYTIPYRCLYSRSVDNLFLAGRIISVSHVAFGSTRVMATCAHTAQAAGMAAAHCLRHGLLPRGLSAPERVGALQRDLLRAGQFIPGLRLEDPEDLARSARITASSRLQLAELPPDGCLEVLSVARAQMVPVAPGPAPQVSFLVDAERDTGLEVEVRTSDRPCNHTPDVLLARHSIPVGTGDEQWITIDPEVEIDQPRYLLYCLMPNAHIAAHCTRRRVTGLLSVRRRGEQCPGEDIGIETFEFWCPERRPEGYNLAVRVEPALELFGPENVVNGVARPTCSPNAWVAEPGDPHPTLTLEWEEARTIGRVELVFDTDFDHPMESVLMGHPERVMPFCVKRYLLRDGRGRIVAEEPNNHQTRNTLQFSPALVTDRLTVELLESHGDAPAALFEIRCYRD